MFAKLFIKEWKEKAALAAFGMAVTAAFVAAASAFVRKPELAEGLAYAALLFFLPVLGLLLGSVGFEAEFRDGAWAYVLSRPVRRTTVWFSKYAALVTMLAASWLLFAAVWLTVPGFRDLVGGLRVLFGFGAEFSFPWLSVLGSFFLLTLAFSLSILAEKPFHAFLAALLLGLAVSAAAFSALSGAAALINLTKALRAFELTWVLTAAAMSAASILTFVKADFSQPRRKTAKFLPAAAAFILAAFSMTAVWMVWGPVRGERFLYWTGAYGDNQYFSTEIGVLRYSPKRDKLSWLAKGVQLTFPWANSSRGWQAYLEYKFKGRAITEEALWVVNSDGSRRKRVLRLAAAVGDAPGSPQNIQSWAVSPDPEGRRVAFLAGESGAKPGESKIGLWMVNSDGTGLEPLPLDAATGIGSPKKGWAHLAAWSDDGEKLVIYQRGSGQPTVSRLWLYDLQTRTTAPAVDSGSVGFCVPSPDGKYVSVPYRSIQGGPIRLGLLNLRTMAVTDLDVGATSGFTRLSWGHKGDKFMFTAQRKGRGGSDDYVWRVYGVNDGKLLAEREAGRDERAVLLGMAGWMTNDGQIARLDVTGRALVLMSPDLRDMKSVPLPRRIVSPSGLYAAGDKVLVQDSSNDTLWRYDTAKDSWKKIH